MKEFIKKRLSLTITLVLFVFGVLTATFLVAGGITILLQYMDLVPFSKGTIQENNQNDGFHVLQLVYFLGFCILLGTAFTAFLSRIALNPIRKVIDATHQVAEGDFTVKVNLKGIGELEELSQSFNKMTQELSSIETLRSDFMNHFSHEFKTPIVSLRGFAKLLKEDNLSAEEKREYLDIIIKESERLADLSTSILMLSRYENLEIITDKITFRLDEQIRRAIVLMEPKWSVKELIVHVRLDEVIYSGNEDLTQQIWLNLLDNAIKFSYQGGAIYFNLTRLDNGIEFVIRDNGLGMDEQTTAHIFDKFYQGDASHSGAGSGLGLSIVNRIVELHGGKIDVQSEIGQGSTFSVRLS